METMLIVIKARAIIASSNFVKDLFNPADTEQRAVMVLQPTGKETFTVLGNIHTGSILVNGALLAAPWLNLNVQSSAL
jgi:hypothetical protein